MLRHDLTESRVRFLAAVLSENVQRANFNPIEEADGLRAMLDLHNGNQAAAARAMGKSKQWSDQRIGLLRLSDQMVELVSAGKLTGFRDMRRYASLPPQGAVRDMEAGPRAARSPEADPAQDGTPRAPEASGDVYRGIQFGEHGQTAGGYGVGCPVEQGVEHVEEHSSLRVFGRDLSALAESGRPRRQQRRPTQSE